MSEDNKQAVVDETDAPATEPAKEVDGAQDGTGDLNELLNEFDQSSQPEPPAQPAQQPDTDLRKEIEELKSQVQQSQFNQDFGQALDIVRGDDLDPEIFDNQILGGIVEGMAKDDPRLQEAWLDRHKNPQRFNRIMKGVGAEISKKFSSMPDRAATEDREAVTAAVRGTSTKAPDPDEVDTETVARMSDAEFEQWQREQAKRM